MMKDLKRRISERLKKKKSKEKKTKTEYRGCEQKTLSDKKLLFLIN